MPRIAYEFDWRPRGATRALIDASNAICAEYAAQGFNLTLRQLFYQHVARGNIPNTQKSYKAIGNIINKARLGGMLDWSYIVDRTRNLSALPHWNSPGDVINAAASSYALDKWTTQDTRVEVWVEKEALAGIIGQAAEGRDAAWFSCRGYVSQSELWGAAARHLRYINAGQKVLILHLGDHDPSGIDMTRDITDRLEMFIGRHYEGYVDEVLTVKRIALNMDQIELYDPPPNPAKTTDSRFEGYIEVYGTESWELDALDPATLNTLITEAIEEALDVEAYEAIESEQEEQREVLTAAAQRWTEVADFLNGDTD